MQLAIRTLKRHKRQSAKRGKTKRWQKHFSARQKSRTPTSDYGFFSMPRMPGMC